MSDRLQFFREQMAAFEGTSDPQKAIEKGYFIKQPRNSLANTIANRIALRPSSSHLLIGGIGSGKTTQLMMARDRINEIGDTHAVYVDASLYTDISKIQPGALIVIVGLILSKLGDNEELGIFFNQKAYGYIEKKAIDSLEKVTNSIIAKRIFEPHSFNINEGISDFLTKTKKNTQYQEIKHEGILNKKTKPKTWQEIVKQLRKANQSTGKKNIILIDGLDRLNNIQTFLELVNNDIETLNESEIGVLVVGSLTVAYSESRANIEQQFNYFYHQPCFDVSKDGEALDFFKNVLKVRLKQQDFIDSTTKYNLINYSGGVLRDLINLTQAAIEEAYISDSDNVEENHVERAINSFGRGKMLGTTDDELKVLKTMCQKDNFIPRTQEDIQLLASQRILEYQYPKKRFAVHPTIKEFLQKASV